MRAVRRTAVLASLGLALSLVAAAAASAQYREFTGNVDKIDAQKMIVDNRMGDKVAFERLDETVVSGQQKKTWWDLKKNDWVTVHWKMTDKPRKAYEVDVLSPKDAAGDDL
jgi:hypothetical protein